MTGGIMAEAISFDEAVDFINRLCAQANAPATPPNTVRVNCTGVVAQVDLSALPPGTLIDSYVTGEYFKVDTDYWASTRCPGVQHTDEDVATQVRLGWHADSQESDFDLIHVGE